MYFHKDSSSSKEDCHNNNSGGRNNSNNSNNFSRSNNNNNNNPNGYKLLSAEGMANLQDLLKQHGNECIKHFIQVGFNIFFFF